MKYTLTLLLFCIVLIKSNAQELNVGPFVSIPTGAFASKDLDDGGFASVGHGIFIESKHRMQSWPEWLHIATQFSYQTNELDGRELSKAYSMTSNSAGDWLISSTFYRPLTFTAGPVYGIQLTEKFSLNFKGGMGLMLSNIDPLRIRFLDDNQNQLINIEIQFESKPVFTYNLGFDVEYQIASPIGVSLFGNFLSANEKIKSLDLESNQKIKSFNTGILISLKF